MLDEDEKGKFDLEDNIEDTVEDEVSEVSTKDKKSTRKSAKLTAEYDSSFDGEEKVLHKLASVKSTIEIKQKEVNIDDIITSNFKKIGRSDSISGLTGVVSEWGVVSPVHLLALEDDDCYQLLDGLRRIFAALRAGKKTIVAMVWEFSDRREGKELANIVSLMINRHQTFTPKEMWEQMKVLESVNDATPGLIEYLLQMNSGDAMKLKDVMLADSSYDDFRDSLLNGKYTIEQAYKKLCAERKKEDKLDKEDKMSIDAEGIKTASPQDFSSSSDDEVTERLGSDEVKDLLEMTQSTEDLDEVPLEDLNMTDKIRKDTMHQKVGERTFIDPVVKKATLIRDENRCRCCGIGGAQWAGILVYHHVIPVYASGPDTVENGLTLCTNCHLTLHNYITGDVQVDVDGLDDKQQKIFKNIFKYGNIAIEAGNKLGMKRDEVKKADAPSRKHPMPNANVRINKEALAEAEKLDAEKHESELGGDKLEFGSDSSIGDDE